MRAWLLILAACGVDPNEEVFLDEYPRLRCEYDERCHDLPCLTVPEWDSPPECLYNDDAADACLDALENGPCLDTAEPPECAEVYDCGP